jgi:general secretion pathway protein E/type IV pilus assembly protein PilB
MPIGSLLIQRGHLSQGDLDRAVAEQRSSGERLDRVLLRLNLASREQVLAAVGDQFHMPVVDLATITVEPETLAAIPAKLVFRNKCVPIQKANGVLTVATSDPYELAVLDELRLVAGCSIELVLADDEELHKFIRANYGVGGDTLDALSEGTPAIEAKPVGAGADSDVEQAQEASVIKLVNDLLTEAISERSTDVHVEPYEHELIIRYRIDGVLQKANVPPTINRFGAAIISRLKIMANLNIAEKRRPQDGRITFKCKPQGAGSVGGKQAEFDLRVSIIPMLFGEGVVLRVLSKTAVLMSLDDLGMPPGVRKSWDSMINRPHGILLVTGPTGSGKSTTLYASLNRIVSDAIKVITVEDPVEYHISGINQIQVNHKVGLDFASGLRSILRHDPDVVMIGEIRDKETAETAIQASLTGHLVFSTLHTNDSAGAMTRLLDMGVEPFLVSSSLEGVMAQRLVRKVCPDCSLPLDPADPHHADLPPGFELQPTDNLRHAKGCRNCRNTGYRGRLGVYELLRVNDALREMVMDRINAPQLAAQARKDGNLTTLLEDGYTKARAGVTTLAEVAMAISE